MNRRLGVVAASLCAVLTELVGTTARHQDLTHQPAVEDAVVNFGVLHALPTPPEHVLDPKEVTIFKNGTVTFIMNGPGHGIAIYPVSKNTTREHIEAGLCQGGPAVCNASPAPGQPGTGTLAYRVFDGHGDLVIDIGPNPPENRINYAPGQLWAAGAGAFLIGSARNPTTGAVTPGTEVRYRFEKTGRYLVVCMNRPHTINDMMFGFVNVV